MALQIAKKYNGAISCNTYLCTFMYIYTIYTYFVLQKFKSSLGIFSQLILTAYHINFNIAFLWRHMFVVCRAYLDDFEIIILLKLLLFVHVVT